MRHGVLGAVVCAVVVASAPGCGGDDGGGGSTGGAGGAVGGAGGATGGTSGGGAGGAGGSSGSGGSAGASPCTMTWSGAATGTADCTDSTSSQFMGIATGTTVTWQVSGETADHKVTFSFALAKPPTAMTYDGTTANDQFCTATITTTDFKSTWTADSKAAAAGSSCSITLTSVTEQSTGASSKFLVHGTATATLLKAVDASTATLSVTF